MVFHFRCNATLTINFYRHTGSSYLNYDDMHCVNNQLVYMYNMFMYLPLVPSNQTELLHPYVTQVP